MLDEAVVQKVLTEALGRGGDMSEIFVEERRSTTLRLEDSRVEDVAAGRDAGVGVRVIAGERSSYAYTNVLTESALLDAARAARAGLDGPSPEGAIDLRRSSPDITHPVAVRPEEVPTAEKVDALNAADASARAAGGDVRQVIATYADVRQRVLVANSRGTFVEDDRTRVRFGVQVVAARDGIISTGFEAPGHSGGFELLEARPPAALGASAAEKAVAMLDGKPAPAGEFSVVLAPGTGGVLIHEACGHGLEADTLVKDASVYAGRNGERFGSTSVTITDDATEIGAWGSFG